MKIGTYELESILSKTLLDKEIFKRNFIIASIAVFVNTILAFFLPSMGKFTVLVTIIAPIITSLAILYGILNATNYFATKITSNNKAVKNVSFKQYLNFVGANIIYTIAIALLSLIFVLFGLILKIPVAGTYLFGILTPLIVIAIAIFILFAVINNLLLPAMFVDSKKNFFKDIYTDIKTISFQNPFKTVFDTLLAVLIVAIPLVALFSLLFGTAFAALWSLWRVYGMGYILALSIQGGSNFLSFFIDLTYQLIFAIVATSLVNSFSGIFHSIYKNSK